MNVTGMELQSLARVALDTVYHREALKTPDLVDSAIEYLTSVFKEMTRRSDNGKESK